LNNMQREAGSALQTGGAHNSVEIGQRGQRLAT
jgi:hypothetical protein